MASYLTLDNSYSILEDKMTGIQTIIIDDIVDYKNKT